MSDKPDPYASEAETQALMVPDTRTQAERKLAQMMAERGADEQGVEAYLILRQIALELLAKQPVPVQQEPDKHQMFIDSLPKHEEEKMLMQIDHWSRQTYKRYQAQVRGNVTTSNDLVNTHIIFAALRWAKENGNPLALAEQPSPQPAQQEWIETACALIKAADDAAHDSDYMLDSNDCIKVLRGQWNGPLMNDKPAAPQPAQQQEPVAWMHEWEDGERIPTLHPRDARESDKPTSVRPLVYGDTSPSAHRKPLTDDERIAIVLRWKRGNWTAADIIDAVEAAHNIKEQP